MSDCTVCGYDYWDQYCRVCGNDRANPLPPDTPGAAALRSAYSFSGDTEDHRQALPHFQEAAKHLDSLPPVLALQVMYDYLRCHYQATGITKLADLPAGYRETVLQLARDGQERLSRLDEDYFRSGHGLQVANMFKFTLREADLATARAQPARQSGCFIATAAFGTPCASEVVRLRLFRDDLLTRFLVGRALTRLYYRVSPALARQLEGRPRARAFVRGALRCFLALLGAASRNRASRKKSG